MFIAGFWSPARAEICWRHVDHAWWEVGLPGGHKSECFSRYFLPLVGSLTSWWSSRIMVVLVLQEFEHVTVCEVSASLSVLLGDLFLFDVMGGIVAFFLGG